VHVIEDVFTRKYGALRQSARTRAMHRKDGHDDVQAEFVMQLPSTKRREIKRRAAHLGSVHTHQPRPWLRVAQQQRVLAVVGGISQPSLCTRFTRVRCVSAVELDPVKAVSAPLHRPDGDIRKRRGLNVESPRSFQPPFVPVKLQCRDDFAVDSLERTRVANRAASLQPHQDDLIAKSLPRQSDSGSSDRKVIRLAIDGFQPRTSNEQTGTRERSDRIAQNRTG
jgi:hypothetical protein